MTPFESALHNFEAWAWSVNDEVGAAVSAIIARDYEARRRPFAGFGDGDPFDPGAGGFTDPTTGQAPGDLPASWDTAAQTSVVSSLGDWLEHAADTVLKTAGTYYTAKAQLATLKAQAGATPAMGSGVYAPAGGGLPTTALLIGGLGLAAVLAFTSSRGGPRR